MKLFLLIFLLPFTSTPIGYRQLQWSDFKGKPYGGRAAVTYYVMWTSTKEVDGVLVEQHAEVRFDPYKSFTRTHKPEVLKHEQGHLDIAYWYAAQLKLGMNPDSLWKVCDNEQVMYDEMTNHSQDTLQQRRWNERIAELLNKL
jgi:hypothetical protein